MSLWFLVLAIFISLAIAAVLAFLLWRPVANLLIDAFVKRLMKDPYPENITEMYNVFTKVGFQNVLETDLRGTTGEPLERPFGTSRDYSAWDKLLLNPVYLSGKPVVESVAVDTQVILGPQAKRPLYIDMPIMIAGMGYGLGLSLQSKIALAKAADMANTVANTGAGPFLPEERKHTKRLIIQYHRGHWAKDEEVLRQADAIEIQLGYGALASSPVWWRPENLSPEFRDYMGLKPGDSLVEEALLPNVKNGQELTELVNYLRKLTNGVPIGVKLGATHYLERELETIFSAGIDFIDIAGAEAGIHFGPGILLDDTGIPTLPALCRTAAFINNRGLKDRVSLIIGGGLVTPGQFLKAIALGANAVSIGTALLLALMHTQVVNVFPFEPFTELIYENGKSKHKLKVNEAAKSAANYLKSCNQEIMLGMRSMGKTSLKELSTTDLCALSPEVAQMTGVELGLFTPGKA